MPTEVVEAEVVADALLGAPYLSQTFDLAPDDEGPVVATLVRRAATEPTGRAVLHVHGFADYFFQTAAADHWTARGYDFYALDLRKYGRSLQPHQTPNYVGDLSAYYEELDLAWAAVTADHDEVVISAHSTGGLTCALWLHDRGHRPSGVFLNAPWLDMQGDTITRLVAMPVIERLGAWQPGRVIPRNVSGIYARSLHREYAGEWDFDLGLKPIASFPVHAGWIRAIRAGHARVAAGLDVQAPVLVVCSARSGHPASAEHPDVMSTDIVLDVEQIRRRAPLLGHHVSLAMIDGALHDVTLSPEPVRTAVFDELDTFLGAYAEPGRPGASVLP
jgi:alpha-beta hydrolase superfamily lysophospholipase